MAVEKLSIMTIGAGAVVDRINVAIANAIANITDFDFPEAGKRTVSIRLKFEAVMSRERQLLTPVVLLKLPEKALPSQFVSVNVLTQEAWVANEVQEELYPANNFSFAADYVPTLQELNYGQLVARIDEALNSVISNICDLDTTIKGAREVAIQLQFTVDERAVQRNRIHCLPSINTKPQTRAVAGQAFDLKLEETDEQKYPLYDQTTKGASANA